MRPNFETIIKTPSLAAAAVSDATWRGELSLNDVLAMHPAIKDHLAKIAEDYAGYGCESLNGMMLGLEQAYTKFMLNAAEETDPKKSDRWLQMALKCQEQYRKSLQTVHEIRNPTRVQFIKSYVEQQLNQMHVGQTNDRSLGEFKREPVDTRAAAAAARVDSRDQTLVEIDRATNAGRQGTIFDEC